MPRPDRKCLPPNEEKTAENHIRQSWQILCKSAIIYFFFFLTAMIIITQRITAAATAIPITSPSGKPSLSSESAPLVGVAAAAGVLVAPDVSDAGAGAVSSGASVSSGSSGAGVA